MKIERIKAFVNGQIKEFTPAGFEMAKEYYGAVLESDLLISKPIELSQPLLIPKPIELNKPILKPAEIVKTVTPITEKVVEAPVTAVIKPKVKRGKKK